MSIIKVVSGISLVFAAFFYITTCCVLALLKFSYFIKQHASIFYPAKKLFKCLGRKVIDTTEAG
jgi:hypothetical protein